MVTDLEYPYRPAFSLLTKLLDEHATLAAQLPAPSAAPSFGSASANAFGANPSQAAAGGLPPAQKGKLEGTLATYLTKYQDPKQADTIMKVQKELDETKIVLVRRTRPWSGSCRADHSQHKTIESVLERGEKLDNLVERSNALSAQSKMFYKTAKKVRNRNWIGRTADVPSKTRAVWSCKRRGWVGQFGCSRRCTLRIRALDRRTGYATCKKELSSRRPGLY
jgi:synaptobrevin family protein YKT6